MNESVNEDLGYPIVVGENLREAIRDFGVKQGPVAVILCDANPRVRAIAAAAAAALGSPPVLHFALGERRKRLATVERVMSFQLVPINGCRKFKNGRQYTQ